MTHREAKSFVEDHSAALGQIYRLLCSSSERSVDLVSADFEPFEITSSDAHASLTRLYFWRKAKGDVLLRKAGWKAGQRAHGGVFSMANNVEVRLLKRPPNVTELPEAQEGVAPLFPRKSEDMELPYAWTDTRIQHAIYWDVDQYGVITRANFVIGFDLSSTNATVWTEFPLPHSGREQELNDDASGPLWSGQSKSVDPFSIFFEDADADGGTGDTN